MNASFFPVPTSIAQSAVLFEALRSIRETVLVHQRDPRLSGADPFRPSAAQAELEQLAEQLAERCNEIVGDLQCARAGGAEREAVLRARLLTAIDCGADIRAFEAVIARAEAELA